MMRPQIVAVILLLVAGGCHREWSLPPLPTGNGGCTSDDDCSSGICVSGKCNYLGCRDDDDCNPGVCGPDKKCDQSHCNDDDDCMYGICTAENTCDTIHCRSDDDCVETMVCSGGSDTEIGNCVQGTMLGPEIEGDATALKMLELIDGTIAFIETLHPEAFLYQINGNSIKADGSVDITQDYASSWMFMFQEGTAETEPAKQVLVMYCLQGGSGHGMYLPESGEISTPYLEIPEEVRTSLLDSDALIDAFLAEAGCLPPGGNNSDSLMINQKETGPWLYIGNWKSQSAMGNPVTGEFEYVSCD